jgi:hypothetical protein
VQNSTQLKTPSAFSFCFFARRLYYCEKIKEKKRKEKVNKDQQLVVKRVERKAASAQQQ